MEQKNQKTRKKVICTLMSLCQIILPLIFLLISAPPTNKTL
jgi:hypothetical protein